MRNYVPDLDTESGSPTGGASFWVSPGGNMGGVLVGPSGLDGAGLLFDV